VSDQKSGNEGKISERQRKAQAAIAKVRAEIDADRMQDGLAPITAETWALVQNLLSALGPNEDIKAIITLLRRIQEALSK
jgi:hypothetical protein